MTGGCIEHMVYEILSISAFILDQKKMHEVEKFTYKASKKICHFHIDEYNSQIGQSQALALWAFREAAYISWRGGISSSFKLTMCRPLNTPLSNLPYHVTFRNIES